VIPLAVRQKISNTLKERGVFPNFRYDVSGKKRSNEWKEKMRNTMRIKYPPVLKMCLICKKIFRIPPARKNIAITCSRFCQSISFQKSEEHKRMVKNISREKRRCAERFVEGYFTKEEWEEKKRTSFFKCVLCGESELNVKLTIDHIIPISRGGTNYISNIQPLCGSCNSKKHNKLPTKLTTPIKDLA